MIIVANADGKITKTVVQIAKDRIQNNKNKKTVVKMIKTVVEITYYNSQNTVAEIVKDRCEHESRCQNDNNPLLKCRPLLK